MLLFCSSASQVVTGATEKAPAKAQAKAGVHLTTGWWHGLQAVDVGQLHECFSSALHHSPCLHATVACGHTNFNKTP